MKTLIYTFGLAALILSQIARADSQQISPSSQSVDETQIYASIDLDHADQITDEEASIKAVSDRLTMERLARKVNHGKKEQEIALATNMSDNETLDNLLQDVTPKAQVEAQAEVQIRAAE
jgi:hypothetical protein